MMFDLRVAGVFALFIAIACNGVETPPEPLDISMEQIAGSYTATELVAKDTGDQSLVDLLDEGAELAITFHVEGVTTGRLFIPAEARPLDANAENDLDVDLAGTWSVRRVDGRLDLDTNQETFLEQISFAAGEHGIIRGHEGFSGIGMNVELRRE